MGYEYIDNTGTKCNSLWNVAEFKGSFDEFGMSTLYDEEVYIEYSSNKQ